MLELTEKLESYCGRIGLRKALPILQSEYPGALFADEIGLMSSTAVADCVVLDSELHIVEVKGPGDTFTRLAKQMSTYSLVASSIWLVVDDSHVINLWSNYSKIAYNCGVIAIKNGFAKVIRPAIPNPYRSPGALLSLLWKSELVSFLRQQNMLPPKYRSMDKRSLLIHEANDITVNAASQHIVKLWKQRSDVQRKHLNLTVTDK